MPINKKIIADFEENKCYHVICKSVANRPLFYNSGNKDYFLKRYKDFLERFIDTYAYHLLHNHVHFVIKTRSAISIKEYLQLDPASKTKTHKRFLAEECTFHELIEQQFNRLFISYALAFNIQQHQKGHLFHRPFKRVLIKDDAHFTQLCVYVHANNLRHGFKNDFTTYKWSSYCSILGKDPTSLKRDEMLEWFGGRQNFIDLHKAMADYYYGKDRPP